jgi:hypothetical protein
MRLILALIALSSGCSNLVCVRYKVTKQGRPPESHKSEDRMQVEFVARLQHPQVSLYGVLQVSIPIRSQTRHFGGICVDHPLQIGNGAGELLLRTRLDPAYSEFSP